MADVPQGDEDDWVKQALADALLGPRRDPAPEVSSLPALDTDATPDPSEVLPEAPDISVDLTPVDPPPAPRATAPPATLLDLEHPELDLQHPVRSLTVGLAEASEPVAPKPATVSRLFERPNFDATNDPGVDEMLEAEHDRVADLDEFEERTRLRGAVEWVVVLGSAVVVALLLRAFIFQAFFIPSESMESTLLVDDRILVNKLSYRLGDVERGEVVVFRRPEDQPGAFRDLIKRVIGLPGETIEARDNTIYINGQVLIEPYLTPGEVIGDFDPIQIPEGEYFVMGDNRDNSGDSRVFGPIAEDRVIGRAFFVFWPLDRLGSL